MSRLRGVPRHGDRRGPSWDDVEETLIAGDVGAALAMDVVERARAAARPGGAEAAVRRELAALLVPRDARLEPRPAVAGGPAVILVVGVNGTGKTTTIGKLASRYAREGRSVILAAADTFRAAAIDQLRIWADRAGVPMVAHAPGADPGAVVYDALDAAVARGADLVIADTAGRLHTKSNLMDELSKIRRIIDKRLPGARARDALRPRRHDRPERARPGEGVPRGGRADRDRADRSSTRPPRAASSSPSRTPSRSRSGSSGWGAGRATSSRSTPTRSWRRSSPETLAADRLVSLDLDDDLGGAVGRCRCRRRCRHLVAASGRAAAAARAAAATGDQQQDRRAEQAAERRQPGVARSPIDLGQDAGRQRGHQLGDARPTTWNVDDDAPERPVCAPASGGRTTSVTS